jgi:methylthioribose-1-phosphate isomerase
MGRMKKIGPMRPIVPYVPFFLKRNFMEDHIRFDAEGCALLLLDQRKLPLVEETFACRTVEDVIYALQTMVVRGAPAIGVSAAYGCRIALGQAMAAGAYWSKELARLLDLLAQARPTAVNLAWAVGRCARPERASRIRVNWARSGWPWP